MMDRYFSANGTQITNRIWLANFSSAYFMEVQYKRLLSLILSPTNVHSVPLVMINSLFVVNSQG
jgi:hypothetical protein